MAQVLQKRSAALATLGVRLCTLLLITGAACSAAEILIGPDDCASGVHLVARGARLSDVLQQLSEALRFQLQFEGGADPVVDVDLSRQAPELVAKLAPSESIMISQARDPRCLGRYRIVKVWVLPKGRESPSRPVVPPPAPRQITEAEKQQVRENDELYRKAHGMPLSDH